MAKGSISDQIYISRDAIRTQIIQEVKNYLELQNVDLTKTSFLSFIIDIISKVTSNLLFYQTSVYREFFMTQAQLPESILNLSAFLGYNSSDATYAKADMLIVVPLSFQPEESYFKIASGFKFKASDVNFVTYYDTEIFVSNNESVQIKVTTEDSKIYNLPVDVSDGYFSFILPVRQYEETTQEFQIDSDLKEYQFINIDVDIDGKPSEVKVLITEPNSSTPELYTEYNSLYLMSSTDKGYVVRRTDDGITLYFGNGLIGYQPPADSRIEVSLKVTDGASGNVIAGSIKTGDKIYTTTKTINGITYNESFNNKTKSINYECTNPSPAYNGEDEESIEEIRSNSITSISSLKRFVSEPDYNKSDVIIEDSPFKSNSLPVLKRSDLKQNEVQLYNVLEYDSGVVPTRNLSYSILKSETTIPRKTLINYEGINYYTLFDIIVKPTMSEYYYIISELTKNPILVKSFNSTYNIAISSSKFIRNDDNTATIEVYYKNNNQSILNNTTLGCSIELKNVTYNMTHDIDNNKFTYTFDNYLHIASGIITVYFNLKTNNELISNYMTSLTFRKSLNNFMYSNTVESDTEYTIYDIPCIEQTYYDSIDQNLFETLVLQKITSFNFKTYRMLTDFCNVKFSNTIGSIKNMLLNDVTKSSVLDIELSSVPTNPLLGDRYIVSGKEGNEWSGQKNKIAICTSLEPITWQFIKPVADDIVLVESLNQKYIYSEYGWSIPVYETPLQIEVEVVKTASYTGSDDELMTTIKDTIYSNFSGNFGSNMSLYKSQIVDVVQEIDGVNHLRVIQPVSNIFFDYDISNFTQDELLNYTPEYIHFNTDDITVTIL